MAKTKDITKLQELETALTELKLLQENSNKVRQDIITKQIQIKQIVTELRKQGIIITVLTYSL